MAKNGCSQFFPTIFPKETGINLEWPKMAEIFPIMFPKNAFWSKTIFSNNFSQTDWYKFGMAKNGCSEFFPTIFPNDRQQWPKMAIPKRLV